MSARTADPFFVTACYLILDATTGRISACSAGHPSPLLVGEKGMNLQRLIHGKSFGMALGLDGDASYAAVEIAAKPETTCLLFTDGVTEAMNPDHEEFGEERLEELLAQFDDHQEADLTDYLMCALRDFMGTAPTNDDICMVAIRMEANPVAAGDR